MKYLEGFRDPDAARFLVSKVLAVGERLTAAGRTVRLMEVCGTHTMAIARTGIRSVLPDCVELLSGPGCPVCVTSAGYVDAALELARAGHIIATFGDMVRVPGSETSLAEARAEGAQIEVCYSPDGALDLAVANPDREVIFLAVGFETTVAPLVGLARAALEKGVGNLSLLTAFKTVPPALDALISDPEVTVDAFICPAHVSAIIGSEAYRPFVEERHVPCVVAGFESLDILMGVLDVMEQLVDGRAELVNQYNRVVRPGGNAIALKLMADTVEPVDASWRGIGVIPLSGLGLKKEYATLDARERFGVDTEGGRPHPGCRCGDVLKGKIKPPDCALFAKACTPLKPVGPCMVSSEGSCAAWYKYSR